MKKRVLHVSAGGLGHGGVSTVIFNIVENLHLDFDFGCVVFQRERECDAQFLKYGKIYRLECYPKHGRRDYIELLFRPFRLYWGVKKICEQDAYDVIHCHNHRDEWLCLLAAKHAGVDARIAHAHNTNSPKKKNLLEKVYKRISPKMMKRTSTISVGCSKAACLDFFEHNDFFVIPNGIDLERFAISEDISKQKLEFVHVGRYTYQKNQEFILDVFSEICKVCKNAHLYLVGHGESAEVQRIKDKILDLGIRQNVEMIPGDIADIPSYYARSRYMIFPSRFEGFGIVLIEAQAMGVQCYVSENIQPEADVGLLTFLPLSDGPKKWAEYILKEIQQGTEKTLDHEKLAKYSNENIAKQYAAIYNGEVLR